jgi:hypothetical protein
MLRKYACNLAHRNGARNKTQWHRSISESEEEGIFRFGESNNWLSSDDIFSLKLINNLPRWLDSTETLNYARYVGPKVWHGFPANGRSNRKDVPGYELLKRWVDLRYTTSARIAKLRRRQACII